MAGPRRAAPALLLLLVAGGCATPGGPVAPPPGEAPSYDAIVTSHNGRLARIPRLFAEGVIEVEGVVAQGDVELWVRFPSDTAMIVTGAGDDVLWLGSDAGRYWYFDLLAEGKALYVAGHATPLSAFDPDLVPVRPFGLLDLAGLTMLPQPAPGEPVPAVSWSGEHAAWVVQAPGRGGPMRMYLEPGPLWPRRIETLDARGEVVLFSTLRDYAAVAIAGVSPFAAPKLAEVVRITDPAGEGEVALFLRDEMTTDVDDADVDRLCDLRLLVENFRPQHVRGDVPE